MHRISLRKAWDDDVEHHPSSAITHIMNTSLFTAQASGVCVSFVVTPISKKHNVQN